MEYKVKVLYHFVHFYTFRCSNELACHWHGKRREKVYREYIILLA